MVNVSFYARVSSKKQQQENTIASQIAELKDRIAADGHELLKEYEFKDDGLSGSLLEERKGLEKLRDAVAEGKIDKIYIHAPDRLSRKTAYQMILLAEFEKAGVKVIFLNNNQTDDTPESTLLVQIQTIIAEYGRTQIIERNRRGKLYAAKTGRISVMANAPYGYRYTKKCITGGGGRFEINEEEAEIVRKIFSWVGQERVSIREVTRRLTEISIITQTGMKVWHPGTIHRMLKNPAYKGQAAYGKTKICSKPQMIKSKNGTCGKLKSGRFNNNDTESWIYIPVAKIINEDLFNSVQVQLAENRQRLRARERKETFLLRSLITCQRCQYSYCGAYSRNKRYSYYRCRGTDKFRFHGNRICDSKLIRTDMLDTVVWEEVKSLLKEPSRIANEYQRRLSENKKPLLDQTLEKQENKLKRSIANFIDSYAQEFISKEEFEPRVKEMKQRLKEIEEQKEKMFDQQKLQQELSDVTNSLERYSARVGAKLDQIDLQTKQNIVRTLVRQVEINHDYIYVAFQVKELANLDKNRHNKIMQRCPGSY